LAFDLNKNQIVYVKTEVTNPSELYAADASLKNQIASAISTQAG